MLQLRLRRYPVLEAGRAEEFGLARPRVVHSAPKPVREGAGASGSDAGSLAASASSSNTTAHHHGGRDLLTGAVPTVGTADGTALSARSDNGMG